MRLHVLLTAGILLSLTMVAASADDLVEKSHLGKQLMAAGRFEEAVPIYRELAKALPGNPGPIMNLGLALHMSGQHREAMKQFRTVIKLQPQHMPAHLFLGAAYLGLKMPAAALGPLRTVVHAESDNKDARLLLGQALLALELYQSAAEQFQKLTELDPENPKTWNGLGLSYEGLASRNFVALEKIALGSAYWLVLVAEARASVGLNTRAFLLYREAQAKMPGLPGIHKAVAEIYRKMNKPEWAAMEEEKEKTLPALDCPATDETTLTSLPSVRKNLALSAATEAGGTRRLECNFWAGRYDRVVALSRGDTSVEAHFWRTRAYNELARRAFSRLAQLPPSAEVHELLATIHFNRKKYSESAKEWEEALKLSPGNLYYRERLAVTLSSAREYEQARRHLEDLIKLSPHSVELNYWLGFTWLGLLEAQKAIPLLEKAVQLDPSLPAPHKELARAYMQVGLNEKAIPHLKAASAADEDGSVHYQLSVAYRRTGQPELAKQMLAKFREIDARARALEREPGRKLEITPP